MAAQLALVAAIVAPLAVPAGVPPVPRFGPAGSSAFLTHLAQQLGGPDLTAFRGLGTWVDAYDFSRELGGRVRPSVVDDMAAEGVRTLYIQAAKDDRRVDGDLVSEDLLARFVEHAHGHGIKVVAWYLPRFVDPDKDWRHLQAILDFRTPSGHRFDALGVDIEERVVDDHVLRSQRLVALSRRLRAATNLPIAAIVVPPDILDDVNPDYWPAFPWRELEPHYDVWVPMAYYTFRKRTSPHRDAYHSTVNNTRLLRQHVGRDDLPVHVAGGLAGDSNARDFDRMVRAAHDADVIGVSSYDYSITPDWAWEILRGSPR